ncbi:MAG: hypothetical protein WAT81_02470 [Candidatus Moraniibacteriota bacterium]
MTALIHIVKIPDRVGFSAIRELYVGYTFRLADPAQVKVAEIEYFSTRETNLASAYSVAFADVITGLKAAHRYDWVNHLLALIRPRFIRFPIDCAELIRA